MLFKHKTMSSSVSMESTMERVCNKQPIDNTRQSQLSTSKICMELVFLMSLVFMASPVKSHIPKGGLFNYSRKPYEVYMIFPMTPLTPCKKVLFHMILF